MGRRGLQPAVFGVVVLSFLLPFANVSCGGGEERLSEAPGSGEELAEGADLRGYELAFGAVVDEDFRRTAAEFAMGEDPGIELGGEPFAVVALLAAIAGLGVSVFGRPARRGRDGLACALAGLGALFVLGVAPVVSSFAAFNVTWQYGYWACLALFLGATWASYEEHRRRPIPRLSAPPGDAAGSRSPPRRGPSPGPPAPPR